MSLPDPTLTTETKSSNHRQSLIKSNSAFTPSAQWGRSIVGVSDS